MADRNRFSVAERHLLAYVVLIFSTVAITSLAIFTIINEPSEAKDIFNVVLPVFSSWVGTILAFYFGRESFESANQQVRELVEKLAPEERAQAKVSSIMRPLRDTTIFQVQSYQALSAVALSDIETRFSGGFTRLPIVDYENKPLYIIHKSVFNEYIVSGKSVNDSLQQLIDWKESIGSGFGPGIGFVVVSESSTVADAKKSMENVPSCQDILITVDGTADTNCVGWISNVRLAKFLTT
ncbi:MAG: hypothetical protein KTR27_12310 [Leptolyngbyaceae cyanobacterium MAG.088]|nr:hypothetical protein [Leptolyngbyaceae cyanobacterium MAG.088]